MPPGDLEDLARLVSQVLTLAGLRDCTAGLGPGGYRVYTLDGQVTVAWFTASPLYEEAAQIGGSYPQHPQAVLDEELHAVMERAAASVLYAAGFTVTLKPPLRDAGPHEESVPKVIVTAAPRFRAWASG